MIKKLEWYVLLYNSTIKDVEPVNVMYEYFITDLKKFRKNGKIQSREDVKEYLKKEFMYHYWSKCEAEMLVGDWPGSEQYTDRYPLVKIDIWDQLKINLDHITDYVIQAMGFKFKK